MCEKAIYPGTFDPVTYGHIDVIKRASQIFEEVVVAVAEGVSKECLFKVDDRVRMLKESVKGIDKVSVVSFKGLVVDFARKSKAKVILRGLRMISDFEYEFQMALTNRRFCDDIETLFLMTSDNYSYVSSRLLKEAARLDADLSHFVPKFIEEELKKRLKS